ncbi:hypothetical protein AUP68_13495 [Ilyonectria robusta]
MDSNPYLPGSAAAANAGMLSHDDKSGNDFDFSIPSDLSPDNGGAPTEEAPTDYYEEAPTDHLDGVPTGNRTTLLPELGDKISYARGDKANKLKIADPSKFYTKPMEMPQPWEIDGTTFSYDAYGHLTSGLTFNADQLRNYFEYCPRQLRLWVQHHPAQCNSRMIGRDHSCRYSGCPVLSKNIGPGWHRVVFDEYSLLTKNGDKDPFHIAGAMHLWCFERCFDPAQYYHKGALRPDVRVLPKEEKNPMALNRHPDKHIVEQTFMPWIKRQLKIGPQMMPRPEEESLSQALFNHHLTAQSVTRQMTRDKRFNKKQTKVKKTADCHKGNLGLWVAENNKEREQKRLEKQVTKEMMMAHGMNANTNLFGNNTAARMAQGANDETIPAPSMQLLAQATYPEDRLLMPPPPPRGSDVSSSSDGRGSSGPDVRGKKLVGKKRARNDGEDDDSDSDSDCDCLPDPSDEFAGPRIYKRAHKRVRISEGDEADAGLRKFNEMLKRRAGELGCRRRTWCSGDDPRRLQRGILA